MRHTLTMTEEQHQRLRRLLIKDDGNERAALLVCGRARQRDPWTGEIEERFVGREVIAVADSHILKTSPRSMTWASKPFYDELKRAESRDFAVAFIHSHPLGPLGFSEADDVADRDLFAIAFNRNESRRPHLALVMTADGELIGRAYGPRLEAIPLNMLRIIGSRLSLRFPGRGNGRSPAAFDRQILVFGPACTEDMRAMRIGIVGCGGTGSAVAALLPGAGAGKVALFDDDTVDPTNLNRLRFSRQADADAGALKVDVVGRGIAELGLGVQVRRFPRHISDVCCHDALKSCDLIFGCTDDHLGRALLNRIAHFYLIPVIDLGLLIEPNDEGSGYDTFDGRVTVVQPGYTCQICRGLIDPARMEAEGLKRNNPVLYDQKRFAGYLPAEAGPNPVVGTFTGEVATMAVNELFHRLTGFREPYGSWSERIRRFDQAKEPDVHAAGLPREGCPLCQSRRYDGRGDMEPFLDQA